MNSSNKAIAKRVNKELKIKGMGQTELLKEIIKFNHPEYSQDEIYKEIMSKKGNFSTSLKGDDIRPIPKEDLYVISKILAVPLEYLWFGEEKKSGFIPTGARYAAYQDNENDYRAYISHLESEDKIQSGDETGHNLFDYFAEFDSINGYRFFAKNYNLHFDYNMYAQVMYCNKAGLTQFCTSLEKDNSMSDNIIFTLIKYKDTKTFRAIYFDNCTLDRFDSYINNRKDKKLFGDKFLSLLLENEDFLNFVLKTKTFNPSLLSRFKTSKEERTFVEPMFYEALDYAMNHQKEYKNALLKLLKFSLEYNKSQYEFIKEYITKQQNDRFGCRDVSIDTYNPRLLTYYMNISMGNIIKIKGNAQDAEIDELIRQIEQYAFNMTHIINDLEINKDEIKISSPDNPLFLELHDKAIENGADFIPYKIHSDKEFTYFMYYDSVTIDFENVDHTAKLIEYLNKVQSLVLDKEGKILVHGNLKDAKFMTKNGTIVGLTGWQKCHYGDKYEDGADILASLNIYYGFDSKFLDKYKEIFDVLSNGFNKEEQIILIDRAMQKLDKEAKLLQKGELNYIDKRIKLKERSIKLEIFKEEFLEK